jgi:hypothetical protein
MAELTPTFETQAASIAAGFEALRAQARQLRTNRWHATLGANMEGVYNATPDSPNFLPDDAQIVQSRMNNYMAALDILLGVLEGETSGAENVPGFLAVIAQFDVDALNNT